MNKTSFVVLLLFLSAKISFGQSAQKTVVNADSSLILHYDERYDLLLQKQKEQNLKNQSMTGYRIQIYFGGIRQKASEVKADFSSRFPDVASYLTYQQPNFKVRVGDFRNRIEAQKFMKQLDGMYPTLFIVPDEVHLPPLK
jgi:hypothetical protein